MTLKLENVLKYMEDQSICMIVMDTQDNSMKKLVNLKDLQNSILMINGQQKKLINGFLKKMLR